MSRWFVATLPLVGGDPSFGPLSHQMYDGGEIDNSSDLVVYRSGSEFEIKANKRVHPGKALAMLKGEYLGRLDEGDFGTTGRPAVILCTGSKTAFQWLRARVPDPDNGSYRFMSLEDAWQITAVRDKLKALGIKWAAGDFGKSDGTNVVGIGRPQLRHTYSGQGWDLFKPEDQP